eukprot:c25639_g1_i1 orf=294-2552(-)
MPSQPCCRRSFSQSIRELNQIRHHSKPPYLKSLIISIAVIGTFLVLVLLLVLLFLWFHKSSKSRGARRHPTDLGDGSFRILQKFTYRELKKATNRFNEAQKLGKGGYGVVYRGLLRNGEEVAVKKLVLSSLQGEREFQNELSICTRLESRYVVKLLGFATHGEKVRLLVYECMQNRSLQEALLEKHTSVHLDWERRFNIILDIARALAYLHLDCHPPVVHGDVKPSNVLLDGSFRAYLADFGLARMKAEDQKLDQASERFKSDISEMEFGTPESSRIMKSKSLDPGSEERKHDRGMMSFGGDQSLPSSYLGSPHSGVRCSSDMQIESEIPGSTLVSSLIHQPESFPEKTLAVTDHSQTLMQHEELPNHEANDAISDQSMPSLPAQNTPQKASNKDNWWWKQENSGELKVRDYVMEWMKSELSTNENQKGGDSEQQSKQQQVIAMEKGKIEATTRRKERQEQQKKRKMKAMEEELQREVDEAKKKERAKARSMGRKGREWWKDEYFAELSRKKGSETKVSNTAMSARGAANGGDGGAMPVSVDRIRVRDATGSSSAGDKRLRGDSAVTETAVSDDLSSTTTSMRGTVCYVAPEFGGAGALSEASDIYSFGVLLLVIISGRRPIEIMATNKAAAGTSSTSVGSSPTVRRFERANLITWARSLAYSGNVLDLVDDRLHGVYPREQAQLCISLALLCIRRLPSARPSIGAVVKTLSGEAPPPALPVEFSPSPPSRLSLHQSPLRAASFISSSEDMV